MEEKSIWKTHKKRLLPLAVLLALSACALLFWLGKHADHNFKAASAADFFAYTDTENRLYLWREGSAEPLLLTDHAFAQDDYRETWDYWQEWDESGDVWIPNEEKALTDVVWEMPDQGLLFPENMRWTVFGMQRGAAERKEALTYLSEEELEDWMSVRAFCYDLYFQSPAPEQEARKLAENVLFYSVDQKGFVWYCQAVVDGTAETEEEEPPRARCLLYRYDGTNHRKIGEINGRREEPYRVEKGGELAFFYGMDDGLYGVKPGKEPELLAGGVDSVLYRDDNRGDLLYVRDGSVYQIQKGRKETVVYAGEEDRLSVSALGRDGKRLVIMEAEANVRYSDWIAREEGEEDADTQELWKLLEETKSDYYPQFCTVRVMDLSASPPRTIDETKGYMLMSPGDGGKGNPKGVYYMEMIPADTFEKIPLSELLGSSLPEDVLRTYAYYLDDYGARDQKQAFAWALEACWEREAFERRASVYAVTKTGISLLDELQEGIILGASEDYSPSGEELYLTQYQSPDMESDYRKYGHHLYYGYLENRYRLSGDGSCQKAVELADESRVIGDEVFYTRNMGLEGYVDLYGTRHEGVLASAADLSLESLKKSGDSDTYLFLAEGLRTGEEEEAVPVHARTDLWTAYQELGIRRDRFSEEEHLHTLMLCREGMVRELGQNIYRYAFYGEDSVWMVQYEQQETSEEEEHGRVGSLLIYEKNETRKVTDQAVWITEPGSGEGSRSASWVLE